MLKFSFLFFTTFFASLSCCVLSHVRRTQNSTESLSLGVSNAEQMALKNKVLSVSLLSSGLIQLNLVGNNTTISLKKGIKMDLKKFNAKCFKLLVWLIIFNFRCLQMISLLEYLTTANVNMKFENN